MIIASHRVFSGKLTSKGYLYDRKAGVVIWACPHYHRKAARAQGCAEAKLKQRKRLGLS